jgi:hypothetical protein
MKYSYLNLGDIELVQSYQLLVMPLELLLLGLMMLVLL